ncbi:MAG: Ger(x)C family spore germination C-terminal domain-containing protein [Oscillospiraceae bacterium]|nr:Ger(x)C family spore germination C-terminal domain-containing protein [Oscillospiraceae bacterium]
MTKKIWMSLCLLLALLLTGCGGGMNLSDRAIVKLIYITKEEKQYQAGVVVYTCDASADTGEAVGQSQWYTGSGKTIGGALDAAAESQNKKPFYAQNEILLISEDARDDVGEILTWFAREEGSRPNMAVFLCEKLEDKKDEEWKETVEGIEGVLRNTEQTFSYAVMLYQIHLDKDDGLTGAIPVLKENEGKVSVPELQLYLRGEPCGTLEQEEMKTALTLQNRVIRWRLEAEDEKIGPYECDLTNVSRRYETSVQPDGGACVTLIVHGSIRDVTTPRTLDKTDKARLVDTLEKELAARAEKVMKKTYQENGIDLFGIEWHQKQQTSVKEAEEKGPASPAVRFELELL